MLDTRPSDAYQNDRRHVFHSWSAQASFDPIVIAGAEGSRFWDDQGNSYLDFSSQLVNVNIGHQHPKLVAAIKEQADRLCTVAPIHANDARSEAARLIVELAPGDLDMVFFTNGGAEATENAIRMARLHTGRHKILTTYRSYHGSTGGSITLTGDPRRWGSEPGIPGVVKFWGPYTYRSAFHAADDAEECERALAHLDDVLMVEGAHNVAAIVLEPVVGTNGILVPPDGYLQGVRERCDRHGIMFIADEVMAGFGRCGEWFSVDRWGVAPDLICFAKGVNSGYIPLGGVVISRPIADTFAERVYPGGLDLLRPPAGVRLGRGEHQHLQGGEDRRARPPPRRRRRRARAGARSPSATRAWARFAGWACSGPSSWSATARRASRSCRTTRPGPTTSRWPSWRRRASSAGLWPFTHFNRMHVVPPLTISDDDMRAGLAIIDEALAVADEYATGS